jgi:hypothetical protein
VIHDVGVEGTAVHVHSSPVRSVALTGILGWRSDIAIGAPTLQEGRLDLARLRSPFWRLTVTDEGGRRAWTNLVWADDA